MAYVPNASDPTQPTEDKTVESAALEFRTIKPVLIRTLRFPAADAPSYRGELPVAANRAGRFLAFDSVTGVPIPGPLLTDWTITQAQITGIGAIADNLTEILQADANAAAAAASALAAATAENAAETAASTATAQAILAQNAASVAGSYLGGFRNRIINGDMRIDQRNAGASVTANNSIYTLDRFTSLATQTAKGTIQQSSTAPATFANSFLYTSSSAYSVLSSDYFAFGQYIEGYNIADLAWGTASAQSVTLSFWVRSSLTGTFGGSLRNNAGDRSYTFTYTISAANTWEQKTVTVSGDTSGTWLTTTGVGIRVVFSMGAGSTWSAAAGTWAAGNYLSATGATSVVGTSGATFYITGVQLEAGSVASPFERRDYGRELMMCQRYYQQGSYFLGYATSTTAGRFQFPSMASMRATPTPTIAATAGAISNPNGTNGTPSSISVFNFDSNAITLSITMSAAMTGAVVGSALLNIGALTALSSEL